MGIDNTKIHEAFEGIVSPIVDTASAEDAVQMHFIWQQKMMWYC